MSEQTSAATPANPPRTAKKRELPPLITLTPAALERLLREFVP